MRRVGILSEVIKEVIRHDSTTRHEFFRAHQQLEEANDPRSWEELATLPAKDPELLPADSWIMSFGNGGLLTYVLTGDDAEIIGVVMPEGD